VDEFFQQQVISLIASREKQAYSAVTGVGEVTTLNCSPDIDSHGGNI